MRHTLSRFAVTGCLLAAALGCAAAPPSTPDAHAVTTRVQAFLDAYAADNQQAALRMIDPRQFTMYGSDVAEVAHGAAGLRRLMTEDHKLWHTAKFGTIKDLDVRVGAQYASAFFDVPFSAGGRAPVLIRVSSVWRKVGRQWLLTQSSNCVPTTGSSAREILQKLPHAARKSQL